jgi:vacuolar iron transporter family protein
MTQTADRQYTAADIKRFRSNYRDEVDGAALYRLLAGAEKNPHLRTLYERLAVSEDKHLALWERKLLEAGAQVPSARPSLKVRALGWIARRFGTRLVAPIVTSMELSAQGMYDDQPEAVAEHLPASERSHARLFREIARAGHPQAAQAAISEVEGRHRGISGNAIRATVLGAQDGLVSNLCLVMGVAGADPGRDFVLLSGVGGLVAGSLSMALGEWISVRSSAESYARQLAIERDELAEMPEEEEEELTLIYMAKGLGEADARATAHRVLADPNRALSTLAREELGMTGDESGSAWVAAIASFLMFSVGAIIPLVPWLVGGGAAAVVVSAVLSAIGLFVLGAVITLFTGRGALYSGMRQLLLGAIAAAITYGIGALIGAGTGI